MNYVDFNYYKDVFKGTVITDVDTFDRYNISAESIYDDFTRKQHLTDKLLRENGKGARAIKFSICEMIDNNHYFNDLVAKSQKTDANSVRGITSESVKDHSVSYASSDTLKSVQLINQSSLMNRTIMVKWLSVHGLLYRGLS